MLNLSIYHKIHLTRKERYDLHDGKETIVTGVSVPIWYIKTISSEPGQEVFCRYYLSNNKSNSPIKIIKDGYGIEIPFQPPEQPKAAKIPSFLKKFFLKKNTPILKEKKQKCMSSVNLLDIKDGGSKSLSYREFNKVKSEENIVTISHYVTIEDISHLENSLYNE